MPVVITADFCLTPEESKKLLPYDDFPPLEEMCEKLSSVDKSSLLPKRTQIHFFSAITFYITMDERPGNLCLTRVNVRGAIAMLMNDGLMK